MVASLSLFASFCWLVKAALWSDCLQFSFLLEARGFRVGNEDQIPSPAPLPVPAPARALALGVSQCVPTKMGGGWGRILASFRLLVHEKN